MKDEIQTLQVLREDKYVNQFMHETKCEQQKAKLYLREFNNNFEKALEKYRER